MSQEQMADEIGIKKSRLGSYEEGRSAPPIELLIRFSDYFHLPVDVLIRHDLGKATSTSFIEVGNQRILFPVVVDGDNNDTIEVVTRKAQAGYTSGYADPEYIEQLPIMKLPFMPIGKHRAFPIMGDSMLPVKPGSFVVGKFIESIEELKDGRTYVIVTNTEGIVYKRVQRKEKCLLLISDNKTYRPYELPLSEVLEIWEFVCNINTAEYSEKDLNMDSVLLMLRELKVELRALKTKGEQE